MKFKKPTSNEKSFIEIFVSNKWRTTTLIDAYFEILAEFHNSYFPKKVNCVGTYVLSLFRTYGVEKYFNEVPKDLDKHFYSNNCELVLIPIHSINHFVLYLFDRKNHILEYYDSQGGDYRDLGIIKEFLMKKENLQSVQDIKVRKMKVKYQQDLNNCGVFVLLFARLRLQNREMDRIRKLDLVEVRKCILYELLFEGIVFDY